MPYRSRVNPLRIEVTPRSLMRVSKEISLPSRHRSTVIAETGVTYDYRMCRRTYAQYLVDEGYPTDKVAVVLGHTSAKTTESAYAKPRSDRVVAEIISNWSEKNESI